MDTAALYTAIVACTITCERRKRGGKISSTNTRNSWVCEGNFTPYLPQSVEDGLEALVEVPVDEGGENLRNIVGRYVHPPHTHIPLHLTHTQPTLDGGSFSSETEGRDEAAATSLPPPSEKEQHQMALLWAMEEVNSPKGWDEEEELDYSAVSRRREERKENGKH